MQDGARMRVEPDIARRAVTHDLGFRGQVVRSVRQHIAFENIALMGSERIRDQRVGRHKGARLP